MAQAQYCEAADLTSYGIRAEALRGIDAGELQRAIVAASAKIDGYLRSRYTLPLARWGTDIVSIAARLAVYGLMVVRGLNSARPGDVQIRDQYLDAVHELEAISSGKFHPDLVDSSSTTNGEAPGYAPSATSYKPRGYTATPGDQGLPFQGRR